MKLSSKIILFANFLHTVLFRRTDYFERDYNAIHMTFFGRYTMEIGQFYGKFCFASESWDMPMWLWRCSFSQSRSVTYCSSFETILDCIFPLLSAIPPKGAPSSSKATTKGFQKNLIKCMCINSNRNGIEEAEAD